MTPQEIERRLIHALTTYDRKQSTKRHYNHYALGIYFEMVELVMADINRGADPAKAICAGFNDRVLTVCLKAVGLTGVADSSHVYTPVTKK